MTGGKTPGGVIPSTYDIYCLKDGRWSLHSCFLHEEKKEALAEAVRLDREGGFNGVRLMGVKFGASGHGAVEVMVWVSPGLQHAMFRPERLAAVRRAGKQEKKDEKSPGETDVHKAVSRPRISGKQKIAMDKKRRLAMGPSDGIMAKSHAPEPSGGIGKEEPPPAASGEHLSAMTAFMNRIGKAVGGLTKSRDAYEMFGLDLFLAGACEGYGREKKLSGDEVTALVRDIVVASGGRPETAAAFASKLPDYHGSARYRSMIESGCRATTMAAENESYAIKELTVSLKNWNSPVAAASQAQGIVTIMFTDIVDSTRMTQEKGDFGAQEVIHAHNAVVRDAIAAHHGHEVKHTGDGIMACFPPAGNAVAAALMIHQGIVRHNAGHGASRFEVRIGLNSGDPIREENDYFGAPVQIAARVCAKATGGQTMVTGPVKDMAASYGVHFREAGKFRLKGIDDDIMLYEAIPAPLTLPS
ncbi:MAG: hypothetical protein A3G18_04800 [Rhodospirillales bacterium RIFCSPLOWO2_12_FULL_58_28]|nr:MAG: hypothetical protein A3H92_12570 [Rhodospirillales bacterium RIFCSPLOWO2_02_FULL_58_16]OHC79451.1 MAG: hypothetical protein A3G18_04800 [Rhodospirillales bacterium RIFCSPLOWO2_12_FULL_58_28]